MPWIAQVNLTRSSPAFWATSQTGSGPKWSSTYPHNIAPTKTIINNRKRITKLTRRLSGHREDEVPKRAVLDGPRNVGRVDNITADLLVGKVGDVRLEPAR